VLIEPFPKFGEGGLVHLYDRLFRPLDRLFRFGSNGCCGRRQFLAKRGIIAIKLFDAPLELLDTAFEEG
jgi:hypothetical protein